MDIGPPHDDVDGVLRCESLQWSTDDGIDHTLGERCFGFGEQPPSAGKWCGLESFRSIKSTIHVVREKFAVAPFIDELPWPLRRFYINKFYRALS